MPTRAEQQHWQQLLTRHAPGAQTADPAWRMVWEHAAGARVEQLNPDQALVVAADRLAHRPANNPMDAPRYVLQAMHQQLARQRARSERGDDFALPWLATGHRQALQPDTDLGRYLQRMYAALLDRARDLGQRAAAERPPWLAHASSRPDQPQAAHRWDHAVAQIAAYRQTYRVTSSDPTQPLGPEPTTEGTRQHRAYRQLDETWRTVMARPGREQTHRQDADTLHAMLADNQRVLARQHEDRQPAAEHHPHGYDDEYGYTRRFRQHRGTGMGL